MTAQAESNFFSEETFRAAWNLDGTFSEIDEARSKQLAKLNKLDRQLGAFTKSATLPAAARQILLTAFFVIFAGLLISAL